jgi:hypothetical protein
MQVLFHLHYTKLQRARYGAAWTLGEYASTCNAEDDPVTICSQRGGSQSQRSPPPWCAAEMNNETRAPCINVTGKGPEGTRASRGLFAASVGLSVNMCPL